MTTSVDASPATPVVRLLSHARRRLVANPDGYPGIEGLLDLLEAAMRDAGFLRTLRFLGRVVEFDDYAIVGRACGVLARVPGPGHEKGGPAIGDIDAACDRAARIESHIERLQWIDSAALRADAWGVS